MARKATKCSVEGCQSTGYMTRGLCKMHYARLRRHGDPGGPEKQHAVSWAGKTCEVSECDRPVFSKGYCTAHYKRWYRYGAPTGRPKRRTTEERFWEKVNKTESCWEWNAGVYENGYGVFHGQSEEAGLAHRYSYELHKGPIPDGLQIDHLCRNRICVNPAHLEAVTMEENLRRGLGYRLRNGMDDSCIHGHKYTPENTYVNPNDPTDFRCRTCARERDRKPERHSTYRRQLYAERKAA